MSGARAGPRVCVLLSTRGFAHGGLETVADHLTLGLAERGYPVAFVLGTAAGRPRRPDPPLLDMVARPARLGPAPVVSVPVLAHDMAAARALARLLRLPPLHVQSVSFVLACLGRRRARRALLGADVGVTFLEGEAVLVSRLLARRGAGSVAYLAGAIDPRWARADRSTRRVATSQVVADLYRAHGLPCDGVVTPGVSADPLRGPPAGSPSGQRLVYVGRLEANKRVDWLLAVVSALPDVELRVVGDGPMRASLERLVTERGLRSRVSLVGALPAEAVVAELRQADVFVFPSAYESFGAAVLEALAVGLPVVASDLPAVREATGGHATLLAPDDLAGWVDAVGGLLVDAELRRARAEAGRRWAAGFTWDRIVDRFEPYVVEAARTATTARRR